MPKRKTAKGRAKPKTKRRTLASHGGTNKKTMTPAAKRAKATAAQRRRRASMRAT